MTETNVMAEILTKIGTVVTSAVGWVGDMIDVITTNDVLFIFVVAVPLVGLGVGLLNRLFRTN